MTRWRQGTVLVMLSLTKTISRSIRIEDKEKQEMFKAYWLVYFHLTVLHLTSGQGCSFVLSDSNLPNNFGEPAKFSMAELFRTGICIMFNSVEQFVSDYGGSANIPTPWHYIPNLFRLLRTADSGPL